MWNEWKNKIKKVFQNEPKEINNKKKSMSNERREITSKMTYQYPENKSFRFPVIPDEPVRDRKEREVPTFTRSKNNFENVRKREYRPDFKSRNRQTEKPTRKVYKKEGKPPFQPTDVPSPVYGFQKRDAKVDNTPAYKRRKEEVPVENTPNLTKNEYAEKETVNQETTVKLIEKDEQAMKPEQQITKEERKSATVHQINNKQNRKPKKKSPHERRKRNKPEMKGPFNVMMNPIDHQLHQEKQRLDHNKKEEAATKIEDNRGSQKQDKVAPKSNYIPFHLLDDAAPINYENNVWIKEQQHLLEQTLKHFNVAATVVNSTQGPSVTRFEVQPEMGVKVSKIRNLSDDLKLNMSAKDIRIEAPIPGKNTVGIEVPNPEAQTVGLQEIFESQAFEKSKSPLTVALGLNIEGDAKITDIQKMPHGLIAGATGSGKSVCINSILISILYKANHEDVKFLLIDPKMVELAPYNGIPHLVAPVITDVKAATQSLKWAVNEMEERYERFVEEGVRDIKRFNHKIVHDNRAEEKMPYIVIVIDELADLMMMSPQDVENSISRIAQKARACGIHLLLATQRPSVDVITGLIKANVPTRIAFSVSSQVDSRTILDTSGAEKLLGKGDMLFMENGTGKSVRLQGPFVSDDEIERVTAYVREIAEPEYLFEQEQLLEQMNLGEDEDELLEAAIQFVLQQRSASTSMLQRHFKIGYNRAARLIDTMEHRGIISGQNGSKPREVLVTEAIME